MFFWIEVLKAILFGIVEGITEWLPISSTGHMILLQEWVTLRVRPEFWTLFLVVIQLGAILAVVILYWRRLFPIEGGRLKRETLEMWAKIVVACIPAAVIGIAFDDVIDDLFYRPVPVALALIVFGVLYIGVERRNQGNVAAIRDVAGITWKYAVYIGLFQVLAAVFPGTSRSGATIIGGLILGLSRTVAAEFTFFMAVPVMAGASLLKWMKFEGALQPLEWWLLGIGAVTAFVVSLIVIKLLIGYIKKHDFKPFGWYRIVLGVAVLSYFYLI